MFNFIAALAAGNLCNSVFSGISKALHRNILILQGFQKIIVIKMASSKGFE